MSTKKAEPETVQSDSQRIAAEEAAAIRAYENGLVRIKIPKIPGMKGQTDVIVNHNTKTYQIQRGVEVEVPRSVALIVQRAEKAMEYAEDYINSKANAD